MRAFRMAVVALVLAAQLPAGADPGSGGLQVIASIGFAGGTDLDFQGNLAYVGSYDRQGQGGLYVIDISEPSSPNVVGRFPCWGYQNDVAVWRDIVVMAMHNSGDAPGCTPVSSGSDEFGGLRLLDVSDPTNPRQTAFLEIHTIASPDDRLGELGRTGTHTVTVVGDTGYVYASGGGEALPLQPVSAAFGGYRTTIVDIRDSADPKIVGEFWSLGSSGCHDITVVGTRAYCAGSQVTEIWDVTDPVHPTVISRIVNPLISFHHGAVPSSDGRTLVIADEQVAAQACRRDGNSPIGAFWFYDITDERLPVLKGFLGPVGMSSITPAVVEDSTTWCTAHNFNMVPGQNRMVAASYSAGTSVIDFSDPSSPYAAAWIRPWGTAAWSSYYHDGYIYTGDQNRGFDVIAFSSD